MAVGLPVSRAGMQGGDGPGTEQCQEGKRSVWEHKSLLPGYGMPVMGDAQLSWERGEIPHQCCD